MNSRVDLINRLCSRHEEPAYLEIGCRHDECFARVAAQVKVGVDPELGGTVRMTSDDYFAQARLPRFDVVFVDGLHLSEQVRRDVANSFGRLRRGGVVVLHDCLPDSAYHADPGRARDLIAAGDVNLHGVGEWCGDVWRVLVELNQRPDVDVALWPGDHGCGIALERPSEAVSWAPATFDEYKAGYADHIALMGEEGLDGWLSGI